MRIPDLSLAPGISSDLISRMKCDDWKRHTCLCLTLLDCLLNRPWDCGTSETQDEHFTIKTLDFARNACGDNFILTENTSSNAFFECTRGKKPRAPAQCQI